MTSQYSCVILRCWNLAKLIMHAYLPIATPGEKLHILEPGKAYPAKRCWQDEAGSTSGQTPAIHGLCSHNKVCTASWILFYPSWIKAFFKNFMSAFPTPLRENKMEAGSGSWLWNLEKGDNLEELLEDMGPPCPSKDEDMECQKMGETLAWAATR